MLLQLHRIIVLLAVCALGAPAAHAHEVALVLSQKGGTYADFVEALQGALAGGGHRVADAGNLEDGVDAGALERADLIVAAGGPAADAVLRRGRRPTLGVLMGRSQVEALRRQHPNASFSAIVLDQPAERQLALIRAVQPDASRIGIVFGPDTAPLEPHFDEALGAAGFSLRGQRISAPAELLPALERVLESTDALLTLPDPLVSGPAAARSILLTSYRYRRPVFAYSRAYVDAGALAAVFSTTGDVARELADWLNGSHTAPLRLPAVRPPRGYAIAINRQVARALNLNVPDDATVLERVRQGAPQ